MIPSQTSVESLAAELEDQVRKIEASCNVIVTELGKGPPVNAALVTAEVWKITHLRNQFFVFFQRLGQVQREAADRLRPEDGGRGILPVDWQRLSTRAGQVRVWLNQWTHVQGVVRDQTGNRRRKLYPKPPPPGDVRHAHMTAADLLFSHLRGVLNPSPQSEEARELGCYEDIGFPMTVFLEHLHAAYRVMLAMGQTREVSFLDVGCGGGMKVLAARRYFDLAAGLEFDRNYAARARRLLRQTRQGGSRIIRADAAKYRKYGEFDVVYFFRPMPDAESLLRLEEQVVSHIRPRTLIMAPYSGFAARARDYGCPQIDGGLFLAKSKKAEATRLRRQAELKGNHVGRRAVTLPGFFDPILDAAAANGFGLDERNALLDL